MSEPNSTSQGSDGESSTLAAAESGLNDTYNLGTTPNDTAAGDSAWEIVSTSNEPATSIDGSTNSSAEAFVAGTSSQRGSLQQPGLTQHNMVS